MIQKLFRFFAVVVLTLSLAACGDSPSSVASEFMNELAKGNVTKAKEHCTPQTATIVDMMVSMNQLPKGKFTVVKEEKVSDNQAKVILKNENGKDEKVDLVKLDGKWKVAINK
jgi:hypothetical protein